MVIGVIIAAAGSSQRYLAHGGVRHKLDEDLGGKPVLQRTVELFAKHDLVRHIVVAGPHDEELFAEFRTRYGDRMGLLGAKLVRGGKAARSESIAAALAHIPDDATHIAVHDGARACTSVALLDSIFDLAAHHQGVVPAIECADSIKRARLTDRPAVSHDDPVAAILGDAPGASERLRVVESSLDRANLMLVQTPQVFEAGVLRRAYAQRELSGTDDAALVERLGVEVAISRGDPRNIKITIPADLVVARAILGFRPPDEKPAHLRF